MDGEGLRALFEPFGPVTVRRMFGGAGGYAEGLCFAIEANGEMDIKADAPELFGVRVRSVHLRDEGQAKVYVFLTPA